MLGEALAKVLPLTVVGGDGSRVPWQTRHATVPPQQRLRQRPTAPLQVDGEGDAVRSSGPNKQMLSAFKIAKLFKNQVLVIPDPGHFCMPAFLQQPGSEEGKALQVQCHAPR